MEGGQLRPRDKPQLGSVRQALGVAMFPLWFWPVFWGVAQLLVGGIVAVTYTGPSEPTPVAVRVRQAEEFLSVLYVILLPYYAVGVSCSVWLAARLRRGQSLTYTVVALISALVSFLITLAFVLWSSFAIAKPLNLQSAWLVATVMGLGIVSGLVGRFAMARLGILPSRWPKAGKS
jgi:hypothetical protein